MEFPVDYRFSADHTWLKMLDDQHALIGITAFAQSELGEIVYADLPMVGKQFSKGEVFGSVEALKTTSDLIMPVGGEVVETNGALEGQADLINSDPYGNGWVIKIRIADPREASSLHEAAAYDAMVR